MAQSIVKLLSFFRIEGESLGDFAKQLKHLTSDEKYELACGVAAHLGEETPERPAEDKAA
jgi:hypothetical protein